MNRSRREAVLRHLHLFGELSVEEAASLLRVSGITVRRDFRALAEQGIVQRHRGGIRLPEVRSTVPFSMREIENPSIKARLAREAVKRLQPNDVILIDGGTTTFHLHALLPRIPLKVITNSLPLSVALAESRGNVAWPEIHLTGGVLYQQDGLLVGPGARRSLREYHARWAFLSVGGIEADSGTSNTTELVADVEAEMIRQSDTVVVLADHTKIGRKALCRVCALEDIDLLITDRHPDSEQAVQAIRDSGTMVELV